MASRVFKEKKKDKKKMEDEVELKEGGPGNTVQPPVDIAPFFVYL